ncbi:hypothetical protein SUGI_0426070 [Cryptomeria japonica]|nr:hypothetical protein SUGI_0426070 [Cryptomeria japonica]
MQMMMESPLLQEELFSFISLQTGVMSLMALFVSPLSSSPSVVKVIKIDFVEDGVGMAVDLFFFGVLVVSLGSLLVALLVGVEWLLPVPLTSILLLDLKVSALIDAYVFVFFPLGGYPGGQPVDGKRNRWGFFPREWAKREILQICTTKLPNLVSGVYNDFVNRLDVVFTIVTRHTYGPLNFGGNACVVDRLERICRETKRIEEEFSVCCVI